MVSAFSTFSERQLLVLVIYASFLFGFVLFFIFSWLPNSFAVMTNGVGNNCKIHDMGRTHYILCEAATFQRSRGGGARTHLEHI